MRSAFGIFLFSLFCIAAAVEVQAQHVDVRVVSESSRGAMVEMNARWSYSLKTIADSTNLENFDQNAAVTFVSGILEVSETLDLPTLELPQVRVVTTDFDELSIPSTLTFSENDRQYAQPAAFTSDLGVHRKKAVASIGFRLLTYNPDNSTVRRYRRIVAEVSYRNTRQRIAGNSDASNPHLSVDQSALADGVVVKIPIRSEGIYRIDRAFLEEAGLNPDTIEPNRLQIFGNGGAPLPALNSAERPADLVQNPVFVRGGGDGSFGDGDVLLFYGAAPAGWRYELEEGEVDGEWKHYVNPFSNENYYFLKVAGDDGLRVGTNPFPGFTDATSYSTVDGRLFVDIDRFNWSKQNGSGLTWISNPIDPTGRLDILTDSLPPGFSGGEVDYRVRVAIRSNPAAFARFNGNAGQLGQVRTGTVRLGDEESPSARLTDAVFSETLGSGQLLNLSMTVEAQTNNPEAAVDWVRAIYPQELAAQNGMLRFVAPADQTGRMEFNLSGFGGEPQVWDVTEPGNIQRLGVQAAGASYRVQIDATAGPRELIAFLEPAAITLEGANTQQVAAQNLHGIQEFPDFVILTPAVFRGAAEELAEIRRQGGLNVLVTDIAQVFNEFSGGLVDMRAARDYFRFLYDRAPSDDQRLKYALFFGDGHFDYRNLGGEGVELQNWLPPFATVDSFTPDETYTSDDYFGLLDAEEGEWIYTGHSSPGVFGELRDPVDRVDIGVGRFPIQSEEEAATILEKIRRYENPETFGQWRTRYTFIADDDLTGLAGTTFEADLHLQNADVVAQLMTELYGEVNIKKIYASSFDRVFRNGFKIPEAKEEIINSIEEGSLVVNYTGHGGEEGLAQEGIFSTEDAKELKNLDRLSIFVTATCSFGWWDLASYQSGAEELLLNPNGGAVALMTTVRIVYTSPDINILNVGLNRQLARDMFEPEADGRPRRLGDILRITKNTRAGIQGNNRKFNLLGDPTMRIGLPEERVAIESLNGGPLNGETAQMRALDRVTFTGNVLDVSGAVDEGFTGTAEITVFDAERRIPIEEQRYMTTPYYIVREELIWRGQVQINQGQFSASFVVPKDISYSNQMGRISVYAYSANSQYLGYNENFVVGGTSANPPNDSNGPEITLFLNDTTFVSGGLTPPEPKLIVKLFDDSGINTVGAGVGHEMLLILNEDEQNAIDISSGFRSEANSFQRGTVEWDLPEQQLGANALSLRAWDVLNNSSTAELDFFVAADEDLVLRNVFNYPNPTSGETRFVFEHNQPVGTNASIEVRVYTLSGRLIRTLEADEVLPGGSMQLAWNGRDEDEDPLATGVYLYKLRVEVESQDGDRQVSEHIEKLAVIR